MSDAKRESGFLAGLDALLLPYTTAQKKFY